MLTKSKIELRLLGSEGINNQKLLYFLLLTALQYPLACYGLLHFLLLTTLFRLHPRVITFSTLKNYPNEVAYFFKDLLPYVYDVISEGTNARQLGDLISLPFFP
jgi:hypothetical protein